MTNEEIRIKIAQAKGVIPFPFDSCPVCGFHYSTPGCTPNSCSMRPIPEIRADQKYPNWPENIADAWELVEESQAEPHEQTFEIVHTPAISDKWKVTIGTAFSAAATAPRAICLAWLAWDAARKAEK